MTTSSINKTTTVTAVTTGTRRINGTDWPIEDIVARVGLSGQRPYWTVTRGVCNGVGDRVERHGTRKGALAEL